MESIHSIKYNLQTNIYIHYDHAPSTKDNINMGKTLLTLWSFV